MADANGTATKPDMATWDYLESLDVAERLDIVNDSEATAHETKCSAGLAGLVLDKLGISKSEFGIYLTFAPVTKVNSLYHKALEYEADKRPGVAKSWCKKVVPGRIEEYGEPELSEVG